MIDPTTGKLIRIGAPPKILQIDFNKYKPRKWEYQAQSNSILNGKSKKKVIIKHQEEKKKSYSNIKLHPQPNSKRTILVEFAPIMTIKPPKKKVEVYFFKNNIKLFQDKKRVKNKVNNQESEINHPFKSHIKTSMFNDYKITQISTLPCSIRRESKFINDDQKNVNKIREKKRNASYFRDKIINDFYSNIFCLPNTLTNIGENKKLIRGKSCIDYTINKKEKDNKNFNNNKNNSKNNNINNKKNYLYKNIYSKNNLNNNHIFKSKIVRKNKIKKIRPLSTNPSINNFNNKEIINIFGENKKDKMEKRYKNEESKSTYDFMKPSSIFNSKYIIRTKYKYDD